MVDRGSYAGRWAYALATAIPLSAVAWTVADEPSTHAAATGSDVPAPWVVPWAATPKTIDACTDDWGDIPRSAVHLTSRGTALPRSDDLDVQVAFAVDAMAFYVLLEVRDDVFAFPKRAWRYGDGFYLTVAEPTEEFAVGNAAQDAVQRWPGDAGATEIDVGDAFVYPGLIDLHSHLGYNALPLWIQPNEQKPFLHHDIWPGRSTYKEKVSWPAWVLANGAPEALLTYVQVQALAGGTTAIQGWPSANRNPANQLVRNIDDQTFADEHGGEDSIRTSTLTLGLDELGDRADALREGKGSIYHCAEGRLDSKVVREFEGPWYQAEVIGYTGDVRRQRRLLRPAGV